MTLINDELINENNSNNMDRQKIPDYIYGRYRLESSQNFDAFLKEIGVGFLSRKIAGLTSPYLNIIKEDNGYSVMKVDTPAKSIVNRFRLNEIFDEIRMDGKICKSKVEFIPPNKFIQHQWDDKLEIKYIREFVDNKINVKSICNNVESLRVYTRIDS